MDWPAPAATTFRPRWPCRVATPSGSGDWSPIPRSTRPRPPASAMLSYDNIADAGGRGRVELGIGDQSPEPEGVATRQGQRGLNVVAAGAGQSIGGQCYMPGAAGDAQLGQLLRSV